MSSTAADRQIFTMSEEHLAVAADVLLDELIGSGAEVGLQLAVIRDGHTLVDAARGTADPCTGAPVDRDTLFWAGSTAKGVASSVAHVLVERGDLTDDMRVVEVWPEFGAHGKDEVTLRQVLLHTAGVPGLPADTSAANLRHPHQLPATGGVRRAARAIGERSCD